MPHLVPARRDPRRASTLRAARAALGAAGAIGLTAGAIALPGVASTPLSQDSAAPYFTRVATMPAYLNTSVEDQAVAEISTVTPDGTTVVSTDAGGGVIGFTDISDPADPQPLGSLPVDGEPTSVYAVGTHILVVVDETDGEFTNPRGHVSVVDAESREEVARIDLGGQPDSIDITPDGSTAFIAIENQRDEEATPEGGEEGDLPQLPTGWLTAIDLTGDVSGWTAEAIDLGDIEGIDTPEDLEPEYVKVSPDGELVALTLQENNGIAIVDAETHEVVTAYTAGTTGVDQVDTTEDGDIRLDGSVPEDTPREPDAIGWIDDEHVAIANEGDWKGGTRTWSIIEALTGDVTFDSGNQFEHAGVEIGQFPESRAEKKGVEPEGLAVATYGDRRLAFVGSERGNYVAVYDVTDPDAPVYQQALSSTPGPEGLLPIPDRDLLVVSSEEDDAEAGVRGTVQVYQLGAETDSDRTIASGSDDAGLPVTWGALSDLSAVPGTEDEFVSVSDSGFTTSAIYRIDASVTPALVTERLDLTGADGEPFESDLEGITALADGTYWVASEGARDSDTGEWEIENALHHVSADGTVTETVPLPAGVADGLANRGFEGVTATSDGAALVAVIQGVVEGDPADTARIARYDLASGEWSFWGYELRASDVAGDKVGLSAIAEIAPGRYAVVERDSLNGPDAAIKVVVTVELPGEGVAAGEPAESLPAVTRIGEDYDLLPLLQSTNGWTQEKVESLGVNAEGEVFIVTDNDALDDANGETFFARAGYVVDGEIEAEAPEEPTEPSGSPSPSSTPSQTTSPSQEPSGTATSTPTTTASASSTSSPEGGLARTGASTTPVLVGAAILLAAGAAGIGLRVLRRGH